MKLSLFTLGILATCTITAGAEVAEMETGEHHFAADNQLPAEQMKLMGFGSPDARVSVQQYGFGGQLQLALRSLGNPSILDQVTVAHGVMAEDLSAPQATWLSDPEFVESISNVLVNSPIGGYELYNVNCTTMGCMSSDDGTQNFSWSELAKDGWVISVDQDLQAYGGSRLLLESIANTDASLLENN